MHKTFYASGFLYHSPTQQILLQQHLSSPSSINQWSLFGSAYLEKDDPAEAFKKEIFDLLNIKIATIYPVYSYLDEKTNVNHVVVYAELENIQDFPPKEDLTFAWFSFKDVLKLQASKQTKHDIVIGQRVIQASERKNLSEQTFQQDVEL